jgi:ATP-dependent protease ClpP protease subunit
MGKPNSRNRFWGDVDPQQRAHLALVAAPQEAVPVSAGKVATFQIYDPIDSWGQPFGVSAKEVSAALLALDASVDTIELRINSPGGDAFEAMAIINALRAHKATVVAVVDSLAASAAADIAVSADRLIMADNAQLMIHRSWGLELGTAEDLTMYAGMLTNLDNAQADLMVAKAGGTREEWLAAMTPGTWYSAEQAKEAGLADEVQVVKPADAKEAKASARFDLSLLPERDLSRSPFAPAARLKPPAEPDAPSTQPKEDAAMADTIPTAGLVKALGLPDDADEDTILEAVEARVTASAAVPEITDDAVAKAYGVTAAQAKDALAAAKAGKVTVSQSFLDTLEANAKLGAEARAKQLADERDEAIQAKVSAGIISRAQVDSWRRDWDRDPASAKAELDKLTVARFPVGDAPGHGGDATAAGDYTDEMAAAGRRTVRPAEGGVRPMSAKFFPGDAVPITLTGTVTEGQLVTVAGAVAGDASTTVAGEAMMSGVSGDTITVQRVGIRRLTAAATITNGQPLCAAAAGQVRPWVTGTDAVASSSAARGRRPPRPPLVDVALYGV